MNKKYKRIIVILFILLPVLAITNQFILPEPIVKPTFIYLLFIVLVWITLRKQAKIMDERKHRKEQEESDKNSKGGINE